MGMGMEMHIQKDADSIAPVCHPRVGWESPGGVDGCPDMKPVKHRVIVGG